MNQPYEIRFGGNVWRVEVTCFRNIRRLSIWPFYAIHDGTMKAGKGGLQIPIGEIDAFIEAVNDAARQPR